MSDVEKHNITKVELLELNEDDLMFITNPGRMGDEDGLTFIIRQGTDFIIYRVDGLLYPRENIKDNILLSDIERQFSKWNDTWKHCNDKEYNGKYKYLYMGFGNGLCIDHSIYHEFRPYLDRFVEKYLENKNAEEKESLQYAAIFNSWEDAFINMVYEKEYFII